MLKKMTFALLMTGLLASCVSDKDMKDKIKAAMKEDPTILTEAIKANPSTILMALQDAAQAARSDFEKKQREDEAKKLEESFDTPLKAEIRPESIRGNKNAPIVLVEYSDFECPFCTRGFQTVQELMKKYGDKIQFVYKHLPLSFHKQAMIASQYYEAILIQDREKAFKFHDLIFEDQKGLARGEAFLETLAKKVGADMGRLKKDIKSEAVQKIIDADLAEAAQFGIQGTPGFLLNGVPIKGAYPIDHFDEIIAKLKEKGKISI
jgi:protein-disulfide isomerase